MLLYLTWKEFSFDLTDHWRMTNVEMHSLPLLNIQFHPRNHLPLSPTFLDEQLFFLSTVKYRSSKIHSNYPRTTIPLPWTATARSFSMFDGETVFPEPLARVWSSRETIKLASYRWILRYDGKLLFDDPMMGFGFWLWPRKKNAKKFSKQCFFTTGALPYAWTVWFTCRGCRDSLVDPFIVVSLLLRLLFDAVWMRITIFLIAWCIHIENLHLLGTNIFWSYKQRFTSYLSTTKAYRMIIPFHVLVCDYSNRSWKLPCRSA